MLIVEDNVYNNFAKFLVEFSFDCLIDKVKWHKSNYWSFFFSLDIFDIYFSYSVFTCYGNLDRKCRNNQFFSVIWNVIPEHKRHNRVICSKIFCCDLNLTNLNYSIEWNHKWNTKSNSVLTHFYFIFLVFLFIFLFTKVFNRLVWLLRIGIRWMQA